MSKVTPNIDFEVMGKFNDFFSFTLECIKFTNEHLSSSAKLTKRETEVLALLTIFYAISNNPYSEAHMEGYSRLFGRDMDRNAMRGYMNKIANKNWIELVDPDDSEDYSYILPEIFSDWEDNPRKYSVTVTFDYIGE